MLQLTGSKGYFLGLLELTEADSFVVSEAVCEH